MNASFSLASGPSASAGPGSGRIDFVQEHLTIGTRGSALAVAQCTLVADSLRERGLCRTTELSLITTTGDRLVTMRLATIGGKGLFTKELEEALLSGAVDVAVHSLKDVPAQVDERFQLATVLSRGDARDALLGAPSVTSLPQGAVVGTSSTRRAAQIKCLRPDLQIAPLRGNVGTRIKKLADPTVGIHATLLAMAGLSRLGEQAAHAPIEVDEILPAVGQGILAIQWLRNRADLTAALLQAEDEATGQAALAERGFLRALGGSCVTPVAAYAEVAGGQVWLRALIAAPDGSRMVRGERRGSGVEAHTIGAGLAAELLAAGGREILDSL